MDGDGNNLYPHLMLNDDEQVMLSCSKCLNENKYRCYCFNLPLLSNSFIMHNGKTKFSTLYFHNKSFLNSKNPNLATEHSTIDKFKNNNFAFLDRGEVIDYLYNLNKTDSVAKISSTYENNSYLSAFSKNSKTVKYISMANHQILSQDGNDNTGGAHGVSQDNANINSNTVNDIKDAIKNISAQLVSLTNTVNAKNNDLEKKIADSITDNSNTRDLVQNLVSKMGSGGSGVVPPQLGNPSQFNLTQGFVNSTAISSSSASYQPSFNNLSHIYNSLSTHLNAGTVPIYTVPPTTQLSAGVGQATQGGITGGVPSGPQVPTAQPPMGAVPGSVPNSVHITLPSQIPTSGIVHSQGGVAQNMVPPSIVGTQGSIGAYGPLPAAAGQNNSLIPSTMAQGYNFNNSYFQCYNSAGVLISPSIPIYDYASILFSTVVSNPAPALTINAHPGVGHNKKIIMASYKVGQIRTFDQFMEEFEIAAQRTGNPINSWPMMLKEHLLDEALEHYGYLYEAGVEYQRLKQTLSINMKMLEAEFKVPKLSKKIEFKPEAGLYCFILAIICDLRKYGDTQTTRTIAVEGFWHRLPNNIIQSFSNQYQLIRSIYNYGAADLNGILASCIEYDKNNKLINKYTNTNDNRVPPSSAIEDQSYYGATSFAFGNDQSARRDTTPPQDQARGNGGTRFFHRGGYGGASRGGQGAPARRQCPAHYRCWECGKYGHYLKDCSTLALPFKPSPKPSCSHCGQPRFEDHQCPSSTTPQPKFDSKKNFDNKGQQRSVNAASIPNPDYSSEEVGQKPPTSSFNCKYVVRADKIKYRIGISKRGAGSVRAINWSQLGELDEIQGYDLEELPSEEITLDFNLITPSQWNKIKKPNRNTFFLKDLPKDLLEEGNDAKISFGNVQKSLKKLKKLVYGCESRSCSVPGHYKDCSSDRGAKLDTILTCIKKEFPRVVPAHFVDDKAPGIDKNNGENKVNFKNNEINNNVSCNSDNDNKNKNHIKKSRNLIKQKPKVNLELNFENQNDIRPLEAKKSILKLVNYNMKHDAFRAHSMHDIMLVKLKIGKSKSLRAMLDSGAGMSIVNARFVNEVGGRWMAADTAVMGIGSKMGRLPVISDPLDIFIGDIKLDKFRFYSLPDQDTGYDVILGRDFLSKYEVEIFPRQRKIQLACAPREGQRSAFIVHQPEVRGGVIGHQADTCIEIPCYLARNATLCAGEVSVVRVVPNRKYIVNDKIISSDNVEAYLEIKPELAGDFPNMGIVNKSLVEQEVEILSGVDAELEAGFQIGNFKTSLRQKLPKVNSAWCPDDSCIYSIMTDQEVVEAMLEKQKQNSTNSQNPNAVLDEITRFDGISMKNTPQEYLLGSSARIYPPRDMEEFNRIHSDWEACPQPDGLEDEWTFERIKQEFKIPNNLLTEDQADRFYKLIHKYRVAFLRNNGDLHLNTIGEVDLVLNNPEFHRLSCKPSRGTPETDRVIKEILNEYLQSGVIKHGSGPYSSRAFVTYRRASEGDLKPKPRLVIDYRNINKALVPCAKYLAGVDTLLQRVKNHPFYSKMDLKGAYHQIGIVESKKDITSIVTVDSQFVFNVMSFGLTVAPSYFEIFMEKCFEACPPEELAHYLDD